ncbi:MAG TPA: hypothetical protein VJL89_12570 [Thermodesulfovibrionia bacterium]|nr:hypothetical protein [Thermodesulfovibrionia bacterium]
MNTINQLYGRRLVICINNKGNEASLEQWKMYQCVPDREAEKHNEIRIIDEEGEDYLYPVDCFSNVQIESSVAKTFLIQNATDKCPIQDGIV